MTESYIEIVLREFKGLKSLSDRALTQMSEEQFFASPNVTDNSAAAIVKHIAGNLISRWTGFLTEDGEKPGRDRDREFLIAPEDTRPQLLERWHRGWSELFAAVEPLSDSDMRRIITIRGEPLTVMQAINRQLTHYAYHVGQIVYLAKHYCGPAWRTLSIPVGRSAEFNQKPSRYVSEA
jgi:hypothetical protein